MRQTKEKKRAREAAGAEQTVDFSKRAHTHAAFFAAGLSLLLCVVLVVAAFLFPISR